MSSSLYFLQGHIVSKIPISFFLKSMYAGTIGTFDSFAILQNPRTHLFAGLRVASGVIAIDKNSFLSNCLTAVATKSLWMLPLLTLIQPRLRSIGPKGQMKNSFLMKTFPFLLIDHKNVAPIMKSSADVCGATTNTHRSTSERVPSSGMINFHPLSLTIQIQIFFTICIDASFFISFVYC